MARDHDNDKSFEPIDAHDRFVDALVRHAMKPLSEKRSEWVDRAMRSITEFQVEPASLRRDRKQRFLSRHWLRFAIAASLLVVMGVLWPDSDRTNSAYATVVRCLEAAKEAGTRHYTITVEIRGPMGGSYKNVLDLYLDGFDRYAVRSPSLGPRPDLWFGRNSDNYWTARPNESQTFIDRRVLQQWLAKREQLEEEWLLLAPILERLSQDYELTLLEDELLPDPTQLDREIPYKRVRGVLRDQSLPIPLQIDVWADGETGVARKFILDWQLGEGQIGVIKRTIELVGEPELPKDWFDIEGH